MTLDKFFPEGEISVNKNTYQILCFPNITSQSNLEKDSYVLVMENVIKELNKIRDDLFFHLPLTEFCKKLDFENTKQYIIKLPAFPNSMRAHYDYFTWDKFLDATRIEMDIIWTHLPEQATAIKNHSYNLYGQSIPILGYSHWIENKEFAPQWVITFYHNNITGMLQMDKCGLNTQTQIDAILEEAKEFYSKNTLDKLSNIMIPLYLGIESDKISKRVNKNTDKIIVFNHRTKGYRGWNNFVSIIKELRNQRQDFKVFCSMIDPNGIQYVKKHFDDISFFDFDGPSNREDYIEKLSNCRTGFHGGSRWAMSSQDGLCKGIPYVYEIGKETEELFGTKLETGWTNNNDAIQLFNKMLDDNNWRNKQSKLALKHCTKTHNWSNRIIPFNQMIQEALDKNKKDIIKGGVRKEEIVKFIKDKGRVNSRMIRDLLNWGKQIGFKRYRNYLRTVNGIYTTVINKKEYYVYSP